MKTPTNSSSRRLTAATWFTPAGVIVAMTAAMTLAACGPRDASPPAISPALPTSVAGDPQFGRTGQAVPTTLPPVAAVAPAQTYAPPAAPVPTPAVAYPSDPAPRAQSATVASPPPVAANRIGEITSIEPVRTRPQGSGAGAVIGGVLGGVVGNQFGHGLGRAAMTGAGAVGGAIAGNNIERNHKEGISGYRVVVRLDNGRMRVFDRSQVGDLHVGDRVRLNGSSFHRA